MMRPNKWYRITKRNMIIMNTKIIPVLIIGILFGAIAGYVGSNQIHKPQIDNLTAEINTSLAREISVQQEHDSLLEQYETLSGQYDDLLEQHFYEISEQYEELSSMRAEQEELMEEIAELRLLAQAVIDLEVQLNELESSLGKLENDYRGLLTTLSIIDAKNYSITEGFEIPAGQIIKYEYDVGYGIIWIVDISFTHHGGSRFECYISWRQGEQGGLVSGGSYTLEQLFPSIIGTVSTNIYDEGDVLFIRSNVNVPDVPRFSRDGSGSLLKKTFEEIKIVVNGDFEEPTWNVEGWVTGGHLGSGSGEDSLEGRQLGLAQDLGAFASQKVYLYESDLYLEFYYRPVPMGIPIDFIVYFDDNVILNESFTGSILPWTSMRLNLDPLMDTYGEHTIKFVVPKNPDCTEESSRVMIDKVLIS